MFAIPHPNRCQTVQPFTKLLELRLQFLFYFRRHSCRLRKVPEHVGISLFRFCKGPFGVFPVAHAVLRFGHRGERQAYVQVRADEIKACFLCFGPEPQRFVKLVSHTLNFNGTPPTRTFRHGSLQPARWVKQSRTRHVVGDGAQNLRLVKKWRTAEIRERTGVYAALPR